MQILTYDAWKTDIIARIEQDASTTEEGDRFVQLILRDRYQLSEDDAVNATDCAGSGDRGVDAIHILPANEDGPPGGLVIQGKYGSAGQAFSPYQEFSKFAQGLRSALDGNPPTDALHQCASVVRSGGVIQFVIATVDPLAPALANEVEDVRALARQRFEEHVVVEAISLPDVYEEVAGQRAHGMRVQLRCHGVEPFHNVYVGAASLVDVYLMLRHYARAHQGVLDGIYDRNVRKWLGKRVRSVNAGIVHTLQAEPERFVAYNNGITLVCRSFERSPDGLTIETPQIVNGCQTTRTLYDFMENEFAGLAEQLDVDSRAERYRSALLAFKLIGVENLDGELVKDITRYSNKQNAVRGRDFLTLEDEFKRLKQQLAGSGYYLEVQTGEYDVLPKAERDYYPRSGGRVINAFDALRFYGSAVRAKPHTAFGRSGDFTPGGREFDDMMTDLTADDLLVPWLIARDAERIGYSVGAKWHATGDDHRNQTRYFFAFIFFRVSSQILRDTSRIALASRHNLYDQLQRLRNQWEPDHAAGSVYQHLLDLADSTVATYMALAKTQNWYTDRNSFLKRDELLNEEHLVAASGPVLLAIPKLRQQAGQISAS